MGERLLQPRRVTAMAPMQQPVRPYIRRYLGHRSNPALATSAARQSRTIHQWGAATPYSRMKISQALGAICHDQSPRDCLLGCASPIFRRPCESPHTHTRRGPNEMFGLPTTLTTRLHTKGESETAMAKSRGRMVSHCRRSPRHCRHGRKKPCPDAVRPIATVDAAAGPGRCSCARLYGSEGDLVQSGTGPLP